MEENFDITCAGSTGDTVGGDAICRDRGKTGRAVEATDGWRGNSSESSKAATLATAAGCTNQQLHNLQKDLQLLN